MNSSGPLSWLNFFNSPWLCCPYERQMLDILKLYYGEFTVFVIITVTWLNLIVPPFVLISLALLEYFLHHPAFVSAISPRPSNTEKSSAMKPPPRTLTYSRTWSDTPRQLTRRSAGGVELLDQLLWHVRTRSLSLHYRSRTDPPSPFSPITSIKAPCHSLFPVGIQWY